MVEASLNIFDLIVFFVIFLSGLIAFFRGFLKEVMSLGTWFAASAITVYAFQDVSEAIEPMVGSGTVAGALAAMGLFFGSLIVLSIFTMVFLRYLKKGNEAGFIDNGLGLIFGVLRGILIVALAYYVMSIMMCERDYPAWVQTALSKDFVRSSASMVAEMAPDYLGELTSCAQEDLERAPGFEETVPETLEGIGEAVPESDGGGSLGEDWMTIEELQEMMEDNQ